MTWEWVDLEDYQRFLSDALHVSNHALFARRRLVADLWQQFPTPADWLRLPPDQRPVIRYGVMGEFQYIVYWAWVAKFCVGDGAEVASRRADMLAYFHARPKYSMVKLTTALGLLEESDVTYLCGERDWIANPVARHVFLVGKSLRQFNDTDMAWAPAIRPGDERYGIHTLRDLRFRLGYTPTVGKVTKRTSFDACIEHPRWGAVARAYQDYLTRSMARGYYVRKAGNAIHHFLQWLDACAYPDAASLDRADFLALFDYLGHRDDGTQFSAKYRESRLSFIKGFLEWGDGVHPFFPRDLARRWPSDAYARLHHEGTAEVYTGDGLAFDDPDFPALMTDAIYRYQPANDKEALCRAFWLIIASCPIRQSLLLNLQAENAMLPLPNVPEAFGIYTPYEGLEKAGHRHGHFPILDRMGIEAVQSLQARAKERQFRPLWNDRAEASFVHLFQRSEKPWRLNEVATNQFFDQVAVSIGHPDKKGKAHAYRHYLITHIALKTGNMDLARLAAGHHNLTMTQRYVRSNLSRRALLFAMIRRYEEGAIAGRFIWRLFEVMASDDAEPTALIQALASEEVTLEGFLSQFGIPAPTGSGLCMVEGACDYEARCLSCQHYLLAKEDAPQAMQTLIRLVNHMTAMIRGSRDFSYNNPKAQGLATQIALLTEMIRHLGYSEDQIAAEVEQHLGLGGQ